MVTGLVSTNKRSKANVVESVKETRTKKPEGDRTKVETEGQSEIKCKGARKESSDVARNVMEEKVHTDALNIQKSAPSEWGIQNFDERNR